MESMTFAQKAQPLIARGIAVFPCKPTKAPFTPRGFNDATTELSQIEAWGKKYPQALVGVPTGQQGVFALDIDRNHANGADGFATVAQLGWELPPTRTHHTRSGGVHMWFKAPEGVAIKTSAGKLGPGLDVRGAGGYVVDWSAEGLAVDHADTIADAPEYLLACLNGCGQDGAKQVDTLRAAVLSNIPAALMAASNDDLGGGPLGLDQGQIDELLAGLDASMPYSGWLIVGQALHHETSGAQAGLDAWITWSSRSDKFPGDVELASKWAGFGKSSGPQVTMRSVIRMVREAAPSPVANGQAPAATPPQPSRRYLYAGGEFSVGGDGVVFTTTDSEGDPQRTWICSPLHVTAQTRDTRSGEWGRLLSWRDADGQPHQWAMPLELLQADGLEVRKELARLGLTIAPGKKPRDLLAAYLQVAQVQTRARCVERLGWHGDVYVTPSEAIGQTNEIVVYQNAHALEPALSIAGTAEQWRDSVGRLAAGNSRVVFAASLALAAPLADIVGEDSGGFHLRGASSTGKTTALHVAASIWGNPKAYARTWRSTVNGLESLAQMHNDGLLVLDELSQCDPREVGEAAYMLSNGQGKSRATRTGTARQAARWRLLFLSAGEEGLSGLMGRAGQRTNAGQEVRLADIPADAGAGLGLFEVLHDRDNPAALALATKDAAAKYHGAVGVAWLRAIVGGRARLADRAPAGIQRFVQEVVPPDASGQVQRVARRFALVATAGEIATRLGLTGWGPNEASEAARKCFADWLAEFGTGNRESRAIFAHVRKFFELHGQSRFAMLRDGAPLEGTVVNRAGFVHRLSDGTKEHWVLPEVFRTELCAGFDQKMATRELVAAGWLIPSTGERHTAPRKSIAGMGRTRVYVFSPSMWASDG
ncbi:MAG: hypothetical protein CML18_14790 [Pusillimonas sp.]|jgi:uncharacterized protein (DUF927 family)|nr:hypothetical protein [Pusillimonas sp.]|tara:strand:+ start:156645 stop:159278 length:2634 start_codon:yes stop_codon:yes gene_type:complete